VYKQRNKTIQRSSIGILIFIVSIAHAELRDPTRPSPFIDTVTTLLEDHPLTLSATWITATSKRATINGMTIKQGDTILNNIKILEIQPSLVIIEQRGIIRKLSLLSKPIKNTLSTDQP
jgi:hypothetical protein